MRRPRTCRRHWRNLAVTFTTYCTLTLSTHRTHHNFHNFLGNFIFPARRFLLSEARRDFALTIARQCVPSARVLKPFASPLPALFNTRHIACLSSPREIEEPRSDCEKNNQSIHPSAHQTVAGTNVQAEEQLQPTPLSPSLSSCLSQQDLHPSHFAYTPDLRTAFCSVRRGTTEDTTARLGHFPYFCLVLLPTFPSSGAF
ncbi:hypothetical protein B0J18DRAFT_87537 [Chaetomium sp. MPI-SDFR-AT-0129]|nr:hypothetical protein B0J18DRAFT_87537 [Chaetomium sp. MPI-SDFR-AT-0129]